jgi:hypothetical protein
VGADFIDRMDVWHKRTPRAAVLLGGRDGAHGGESLELPTVRGWSSGPINRSGRCEGCPPAGGGSARLGGPSAALAATVRVERPPVISSVGPSAFAA